VPDAPGPPVQTVGEVLAPVMGEPAAVRPAVLAASEALALAAGGLAARALEVPAV
jgi:hypothetical protein